MLYTSGRVWKQSDADCLAAPPTQDRIKCPLWFARYRVGARKPPQRDAGGDPLAPHPWGDADNWWMQKSPGGGMGFPGITLHMSARTRSSRVGHALVEVRL